MNHPRYQLRASHDGIVARIDYILYGMYTVTMLQTGQESTYTSAKEAREAALRDLSGLRQDIFLESSCGLSPVEMAAEMEAGR